MEINVPPSEKFVVALQDLVKALGEELGVDRIGVLILSLIHI